MFFCASAWKQRLSRRIERKKRLVIVLLFYFKNEPVKIVNIPNADTIVSREVIKFESLSSEHMMKLARMEIEPVIEFTESIILFPTKRFLKNEHV